MVGIQDIRVGEESEHEIFPCLVAVGDQTPDPVNVLVPGDVPADYVSEPLGEEPHGKSRV